MPERPRLAPGVRLHFDKTRDAWVLLGPERVIETDKYTLADNLQMARNVRLSTGVDYAFNPFSRLGVSYAHISGSGLLRGINLNAPVNGIRPDLTLGNLVEVLGDGTSRQNTLNTFMQISLAPPSFTVRTAPPLGTPPASTT